MLPKLPCLPPNRDNNFTRAVRTGKVSSSSHAQIRKTRVIADVTAERGHVAIPTIRFAHDYRNTPVSPFEVRSKLDGTAQELRWNCAGNTMASKSGAQILKFMQMPASLSRSKRVRARGRGRGRPHAIQRFDTRARRHGHGPRRRAPPREQRGRCPGQLWASSQL